MIIFGGRDEDNNKLNDIWAFNISTGTWSELFQSSSDGTAPLARTGHTCCVYNDLMFLFGGIYEITKELNDCWAFDLKKNKWGCVYDEPNSPAK